MAVLTTDALRTASIHQVKKVKALLSAKTSKLTGTGKK